MKTMTKLSLIAAAIVASPVMAEEKASEIKTTAELGVLITTGNTESSSILGKITVDHKFGSWENKYTGNILKKDTEVVNDAGEKETRTTDDKYSVAGQANYKFDSTSSAFGRASYANDKEGAYETAISVTGGYSFRAVEKENMFLDLNAGAGFTELTPQNGTAEDSSVYRAAAAFEWQINDMTKFVQNVSVERAPDLDNPNTQTISETGVSASFNSSMQMKFTYRILNNSYVAEGFEKTDTETSVTLVVNF